MQISAKTTLKEIQTNFQKQFPYLKLQFHRHPHKYGAPSKKDDVLNLDLTIEEATQNSATGFIPFDANQKAGEFEAKLAASFNLNVQVIRKSYGEWLETWATDMWTLAEQNNRSKVMGEK